MAKYSLIALDMDGTLLNSELKLSDGNRLAVKRAAAAGKHVVLSTGRCLPEIRETLEALPEIRYLVCENGSCVYDVKYDYNIHVAPIPVEDIRYILNLLKDEHRVLQVFHEKLSYFDQPNDAWTEDYDVANYRDIYNKTTLWDEKLFDTYDTRPFLIEKINLYFKSAEVQQRYHSILEKRNLKLSDSIGHMIEVVSGEADKGSGLCKLCEKLGISIDETIAVGDSPNDVEILQTAGLSVAMGNAWPEAKAAADVVTEDNDHDGVARVIYDYLLKE